MLVKRKAKTETIHTKKEFVLSSAEIKLPGGYINIVAMGARVTITSERDERKTVAAA